MNDGFFGLNVAVRGLYTAQRSLDVVNHNLNNVNTPGYSRQQAVQVASKPMALSDGTGMVGTGSDVTGVNRIRDEYLDFKYWSENISYGEWNIKAELLADVEATFNEPSNSGFTTISNEFYSSLQELAKDPSSSAVRALVRQKGVSLTKYFNSVDAHFEKMQTDVNYQINTKVQEINAIGTQIQQLNRQIYTTELDGSTANDLRDQRTLLTDNLSKLINIDASEVVSGKLPSGKDDKHFVITISGKAYVDHFNLSKIAAPQRTTKLNTEDVGNLYDIRWEDGNTLDIKGGELRGYLDVRDGNNGANGSPIYKGIPYYIKKLNEFVQTFAMSFNEGYSNIQRDAVGNIITASITDGAGHVDGYKLDSVAGDPKSDTRFFTILGSDKNPLSSDKFINGASGPALISGQYSKMTAKNFTVSNDIMTDYNMISTSDTAGQKGNIVNLNALLDLRHDTHMYAEGGPEDFMKSLITTMGIDSQQAVRLLANQQNIVKQIENRRMSDSGVSIDEEMANMVKFQHAYNASAKMIQTISEVYDTLINKLGL